MKKNTIYSFSTHQSAISTQFSLLRHVTLPPEVTKLLPKNRLLSENEWRAIGVQQSCGWVHYAIHRPEPQIMLFRRPLNCQQQQENQAQAQIICQFSEQQPDI
ncbi:Cyclin-dependent kinases regulatory subunit 2 [Spatholobus suberectus]|nr:Cyclin-dependent kinases regulatory subunit 2 [Spatholobus suberectus]